MFSLDLLLCVTSVRSESYSLCVCVCIFLFVALFKWPFIVILLSNNCLVICNTSETTTTTTTTATTSEVVRMQPPCRLSPRLSLSISLTSSEHTSHTGGCLLRDCGVYRLLLVLLLRCCNDEDAKRKGGGTLFTLLTYKDVLETIQQVQFIDQS